MRPSYVTGAETYFLSGMFLLMVWSCGYLLLVRDVCSDGMEEHFGKI